MAGYDSLFTFYGLLLGIAVANVAIGFADMWRFKDRSPVGLAPPLLGSVVLVGCMNVWLTLWHIRNDVELNAAQMIAAAVIALPFVFVSRAMFPSDNQAPVQAIEEHYLRHRALLLGLLTIPALVSVVAKFMLDRLWDHGWELKWIAVRLILPIALIPFASKETQRVGLAAFLLLELVGLFR